MPKGWRNEPPIHDVREGFPKDCEDLLNNTIGNIRRETQWVLQHSSGHRYLLDPGCRELAIGRPDPYGGAFPSIDLSPFDILRYVSRRHAVLILGNGAWSLRAEAFAVNCTFVNNQRLPSGESRLLFDRDVLRFAHVELQMIRRDASSA